MLTRLKLPPGFFNFDVKDTMRLIVWLIITAFAAGAVYTQRKEDLNRLAESDVAVNSKIDREVKSLSQRLDGQQAAQAEMVRAIQGQQQTNAAVLTGLEGVRTELRYVNEKIDVLRADVRSAKRE